MNHSLTKYQYSWRDFPKVVVAMLAITLICLLFPRHDSTLYSFNLGSPWKYENLIASSNLSIEYPSDTGEQIIKNFQVGEVIINKNDIVDQSHIKAIQAFLKQDQKSEIGGWIYFIGYFLLTTLIIGALLLYSIKYFPEISQTISGVMFLVIWPVLFSALVFAVNLNASLSPYLIPFCLVPIIVFNFYGGRLALFVHIVVVLIASFLSGLGYEFTFLQILAGIITVLIISETRYWNKFFVSILIIFITYLVGYLGLALINSGSLIKSEFQVLGWLAINSFLLLMAYPIIPIIEKTFGFTSSISLAELTDMNNPLIKELSIKAPGTLQHSLQVSNLSEAAAERIGANSLLVKAAALYHDIGKMTKPEYFIENSKGENHHANLNNFESAEIIISHVTEGEKLAKKARLPKVLIDFITSHHGTTRVEYFYRKQKNDEPDRDFDETLFRYPGPRPKSKEQTILMIADSLEAACKSLKNPTGQDIDKLVDSIISHKIEQGQLMESALTFEELNLCKEVFAKLLRSINHVRIEYPADASKSNTST